MRTNGIDQHRPAWAPRKEKASGSISATSFAAGRRAQGGRWALIDKLTMAGGRQFSNQPVRIEEMKADFIRVPFDLTREYEEKLFAHYNREPYWKAQRELVSRH